MAKFIYLGNAIAEVISKFVTSRDYSKPIHLTDTLFGQSAPLTVMNTGAGSNGLVASNTSGAHYTSSPFFVPDQPINQDQYLTLKAAGYSAVRYGLPIAVIMDGLNGGPNDPDTIVNYICDIIEPSLSYGLKTIVVFGVGFPLWDPDNVIGQAAAEGADYLLYKEAIRRMYIEVNSRGWSPREFAVDIWSEPSVVGDEAGNILANYNNHRAFGGANRTLIVQGGNAGNEAGLGDITPSNFSKNTIFAFGMYRSTTFTHQGYSYPYITNLTFPPSSHPGGKTQAVSDMSAAATSAGHPEQIAGLTAILDTYFDTPEDAAYVTAFFTDADSWMATNSLAANRMLIYEYGATISAPIGSRATYYGLVRDLAVARGWHHCPYQVGGSFAMMSDVTTMIPEIQAAMFP